MIDTFKRLNSFDTENRWNSFEGNLLIKFYIILIDSQVITGRINYCSAKYVPNTTHVHEYPVILCTAIWIFSLQRCRGKIVCFSKMNEMTINQTVLYNITVIILFLSMEYFNNLISMPGVSQGTMLGPQFLRVPSIVPWLIKQNERLVVIWSVNTLVSLSVTND